MGLRLVSADQVKAIICQYENRNIQKVMILHVEKLVGVIATDEQIVEILGSEAIRLN